MYFTWLKDAGKRVELKGVAQSNARVSALMRNLSSSDWFADPELEVITVKNRGENRISEFSLRVKQVAKQQKKLTDTGL
jgi:type IV pilus assembly protein PilN